MVRTAEWYAPVPASVLHRTDDIDIQELVAQAVLPIRTEGDKSLVMKLVPNSEKVPPPDGGMLAGVEELTTGASKEKSAAKVPI
jgi:hypothetical protein